MVPSFEHPITLLLKNISKIEIVHNAQIPQNTVKI